MSLKTAVPHTQKSVGVCPGCWAAAQHACGLLLQASLGSMQPAVDGQGG